MPRKVIVLKFGSSVLQSRADLPHAVHEIYRWIRRQYNVVAVVSAFAGETDRLLGAVQEYSNNNPEAIARIVATGEEVATAFVGLELDRFGIPAQVLDPGQIQLIAETTSNDSEPVSADIAPIEAAFARGRVAVIPGFVARDRSGRVALFGRGGSDLSALFLAKQLNARCRLIKDVDGIYESDPAIHLGARRFEEIQFSDAQAIAGKVVQKKAIAFGKKTGVAFEVAVLGASYATTVGSPRSVLSPRVHSKGPLKVGLLGLGTVGLGVFRELWKHPHLFEVTGIAVRNPARHVDHAPSHLLTRNCWEAIDDVDVVVELIGGIDPAGDLVHAALVAGKLVVTANKLLLSQDDRLKAFDHIRFSAAVGGAVPALEAMRSLASQGEIVSLAGVLNGTCNYILDRIADGCSWEQAVAEAQANGFAEADPRADLSGADTVCKLQLLAREAFPEARSHTVTTCGIESIDTAWVQAAARDGGRARLVGTAVLQDDRVHLEVKPTLVDAAHPFAQIRNEENCLLIDSRESRASGEPVHVWTGRGAGRWPTTAAVMADLFDLARELKASGRELRAASKASDSSFPLKPPATEGVFQLATDNWPLATEIGGVA